MSKALKQAKAKIRKLKEQLHEKINKKLRASIKELAAEFANKIAKVAKKHHLAYLGYDGCEEILYETPKSINESQLKQAAKDCGLTVDEVIEELKEGKKNLKEDSELYVNNLFIATAIYLDPSEDWDGEVRCDNMEDFLKDVSKIKHLLGE